MERSISVVYCDDIREELFGKTSYMGVYGPVMYVADFPATLPKLCIWIRVRTSIDKPFESAKFVVTLNGNQLIEGVASKSELGAIDPSQMLMPDGESATFIELAAHFAISPFNVERPGKVQVVVHTEAGDLRGSALNIASVRKPAVAPAGSS